MKIAISGTIDTPIKKDALGGTEIWTYNFATKLKDRGIDVTLYANDQSDFLGKIVKSIRQQDVYENGHEGEFSSRNIFFLSSYQMAEIASSGEQYDLVHISATNFQNFLPFSKVIKAKMVVTIHSSSLSYTDAQNIFKYIPEAHYVFISNDFASKWPKPPNYSMIYNGIDVSQFPLQTAKENYYFWMGRIHQTKGVEDAIEFAEKSDAELVIAGPIRDEEYFKEIIQPRLSDKIRYVGSLDFEQKIQYYGKAKAFLMPIKWDEPFGLVAVEAMACGTPVLAYRRGALPEIVKNGENGFLAERDNINELIDLSKKITELDPAKIRKVVEENFSLDTMVNNYLDLYQAITKE